MDKSMQQQFYGMNPSRHSMGGAMLSRTRQSSASSTTGGGGGRKSFHSVTLGLKKTASTGPQSISGRSTQSLLGVRSEYNSVESYGYQLPVLVNEALNLSERSQNVSVMCSQNGWAWVVHGRRLLIWKYKDTSSTTGPGATTPRSRDSARTPQRRFASIAQCRELTLPHCDIGHKARLITVFPNEQGQQIPPSCLAVSPTGDVRYWPSIAHDNSTIDTTDILDGQEFDKLLELPQQNGYVLVTTTCHLVFLQLQSVNGRQQLHHRILKVPSGFLGNIGKKFASIIIGRQNHSDKDNKFISITAENDAENGNDAILTVLADRWIQRWRISNKGANEELLYEDVEIIRCLRNGFLHKFWNVRTDTIDLQLYLLDMCLYNGRLYILSGAVNTAHTPQMFYAIAILTASDDSMRLNDFLPIKLTPFFNATTEKDCLSLRFIICRSHLYLYTNKIVYPLNLANPSLSDIEAEKIDFHMADDRILNAAVCSQVPLFFSRSNGLVSVTPGDGSADYSTDFLVNASAGYNAAEAFMPMSESILREQSMLSPASSEMNLYMYELDPDKMYNEFKDEASQLKAAFIYRLKRNNNMCNVILNELLRNTAVEQQQTNAIGVASQLDKIVVSIAAELAEDIPAADPRWEGLWEENNAKEHAIGSSSSLQILTQLKDKNAALQHFVNFLHSTGIWDKLSTVSNSQRDALKPTCYAISDINEKIIAAIALRTLQNKYGKLIDEAIVNVVSNLWKEQPQGNLTSQDIFYVRICKFQSVFRGLTDLADARIQVQKHTANVATAIHDINAVVLHVLNEVLAFREQNAEMFAPSVEKMENFEYLPWTAATGDVGIRDALTYLVEISTNYGARCTASDAELKQKLYLQTLELIDIILDGRKGYLDSVRETDKYSVILQQFESQRRELISLLIADGQYEYAAKLAEKYLDFQSLVVICDVTNNQDRLDEYIKRYEEFNFSQFAINWHMRQNRQGEVFERFKGNQAALSQFFRDHPTLGWLQLIFNGDFERASKILFDLAQNETEFVQRKKCMLSLSKLAAFAAPDTDLSAQVESINSDLSVIEYQESLNPNLLDACGYESENQRVLKVEEIINILISDENESANEIDFRKALELLAYIDEPYEPRHRIWCTAILRDNWLEYDVNNAVDYVQNLLFYKLIDESILQGETDLDNFLPPMSDFLNSATTALAELVDKQAFQYLLKLAYEYANDIFKKSPDDEDMMIDM